MKIAKCAVVVVLELLCELVDNVPAYSSEDHKWFRHGDWGHRVDWFRPSDWSGALDEKWGVNFWKKPEIERPSK